MTAQIVTKSQLMELVFKGRAIESFSHEVEGTFDVTAMRERAKATNAEIFAADLDDDLVQDLSSIRDIDPQRVASLSIESVLDDPALVVFYPEENSHLLIDGIHRLIRRHEMKLPNFFFWMVNAEDVLRPDMTKYKESDHVQWGTFKMGPNGEVIPHEK